MAEALLFVPLCDERLRSLRCVGRGGKAARAAPLFSRPTHSARFLVDKISQLKLERLNQWPKTGYRHPRQVRQLVNY